jgi:endoglucanase
MNARRFALALALLAACSDDAPTPISPDVSTVEDAALDVSAPDAQPLDVAAPDVTSPDVTPPLDVVSPRDVTPPRDVTALDASRDASVDAPAGTPTHPFGAHRTAYTAGAIAPTAPRARLDATTASFYDQWKARYLHRGCTANRAYVATLGDTSGATVSEAHGYGMLITVYMAGHDRDAQTNFDALVRFYQDHPSRYTPALLAWAQDATCRDIMGADSATDGDLDVAYALLLADRQWGSRGAIDYAALARRMIADILRGDVHPTASTLLTGDAAMTTADRDGTRLSDFMPDHLRAFATASGSARWTTVLDREYQLVATLQRDYTRSALGISTGLLPDFAVGMNAARPTPAPPRWLEGPDDGAYSWNACRTPWRLATDWLLHGDVRARTAVETMNTWVRRVTTERPDRIQSGYSLTGDRLAGTNTGELAFIAPFAVSATVDARNQAWLDALWTAVATPSLASQPYFGNTIRLLSMIVVSGNAWAP